MEGEQVKVGDMDMVDFVRAVRRADRGEMISLGHRARTITTVERVRGYMETHLGCSAKEVAYALDLSGDQARRAVRRIRAEWVGRGK
jgi:hypothetical protein